jgi:hypothetical protein
MRKYISPRLVAFQTYLQCFGRGRSNKFRSALHDATNNVKHASLRVRQDLDILLASIEQKGWKYISSHPHVAELEATVRRGF